MITRENSSTQRSLSKCERPVGLYKYMIQGDLNRWNHGSHTTEGSGYRGDEQLDPNDGTGVPFSSAVSVPWDRLQHWLGHVTKSFRRCEV